MWQWIRNKFSTANPHLIVSGLAQAAVLLTPFVPVLAPAVPILQTLALSTLGTGIALPDAGHSMHLENYKALAQQVTDTLGKIVAAIPARA